MARRLRQPVDPAYDVDHVGPQQRLAAREAYAGDAERLAISSTVMSSSVEQLGAGQPVGEVVRHAVGAAQVAAVGQRHPQVAVDPAERVDQRLAHAQFTHSSLPSLKT